MRRREFIIASAATLGLGTRRLWADHHFVSSFPLVVEFDLTSLKGRYTPAQDFYIRNHFEAPQTASLTSVSIDGEVEKPLTLGLGDLSRLPQKQIGSVLECAGDPEKSVSLVSDGLWRGWPLAEVVLPARPKREAKYAHLSGRDGFSRSVPYEWLMNDGLLATHLNGSPLGTNHGAPWRALFPGWYGVNSVKWLEKITLARQPLPPVANTYQELWRGSSGSIERKPLPPVQVKSVITSPANGAVLHRGRIAIAGVAWSGSGKISEVSVSADGGKHWQSAVVVDASPSRYDWARWNTILELRQAGVVELVSKATDSARHEQPPRRDPRRIDYYAYNVWDRIRCVVI